MCGFKGGVRVCAAAVVVLAVLTGCMPYELRQILDGPRGKALAISPGSTIVPGSGTVSFAADGGIPPYSYSLVSGGGALDPVTGAFTAPPTVGTSIIRVTDKAGKTTEAMVTIQAFSGALTISPLSLTVAVGGSVTLSAIGGTPPYFFNMQTTGSGSPAVGLSSGVYTAGSSPGSDTVRLTDSAASTPATATITVVAVSRSVDYSISSTAALPTTGTVSSAVPGGATFMLHNGGTANGSTNVTWEVYLSLDGVLGGGDLLVGSGTTGPVAAGLSTPVIVTGTFPAVTPGAWNLIVRVSAADDTTPGNNTAGASPITLNPLSIDYTVTVVNNTGGTIAGGALTGNFTIHNNGAVGGVSPVSWTAYLSSDAVLDVTDQVLGTGGIGALVAGGTNGPIGFGGTWPAGTATWYLIVKVSAADDTTAANDVVPSSFINVTAVAPVYSIIAVPAPAGTVAGAPVAGTFTIRNTGTAAGGAIVNWQVYASLGNSTWDAGDTLIDSNTTPALGIGASSLPGYFGNWPAAAGSYYIIVRAQSADSAGTASGVTAAPTVVTGPNVDYAVQTVVVNAVPRIPDQPVNGTFQYRNNGVNPGTSTQTVSWEVYASTNGTIDAYDTLIASGTGLAALGSAATSGAIPWAGFWPLTYGDYFILVRLTCAEDVNNGNNVGSSALQTNVGVYNETTAEPNNDFAALSNPVPLGITMKPGMVVKVTGSLANADRDDVLQYNTGTATRVVVTVVWSINAPNVRIWYMTAANTFASGVSGLSGSMSLDWTVDVPGTNRWIDLDNYWSGTDYTPPPNPVSLTYTAWIVAQ